MVVIQNVHRPRVRVLCACCAPDVDRAIGGVKQLYRHVEHLCALGWDAAMVTEAAGFRPSWFESSAPSFSLGELASGETLSQLNCPWFCLRLIWVLSSRISRVGFVFIGPCCF